MHNLPLAALGVLEEGEGSCPEPAANGPELAAKDDPSEEAPLQAWAVTIDSDMDAVYATHLTIGV